MASDSSHRTSPRASGQESGKGASRPLPLRHRPEPTSLLNTKGRLHGEHRGDVTERSIRDRLEKCVGTPSDDPIAKAADHAPDSDDGVGR